MEENDKMERVFLITIIIIIIKRDKIKKNININL